MLFDLCYLILLCVIILVTFFQVLLPLPAVQASLPLHTLQMLNHMTVETPPPQIILFFCISGLIYLKIIWRLINPPKKF